MKVVMELNSLVDGLVAFSQNFFVLFVACREEVSQIYVGWK